eukprot:UC4_evm4s1386
MSWKAVGKTSLLPKRLITEYLHSIPFQPSCFENHTRFLFLDVVLAVDGQEIDKLKNPAQITKILRGKLKTVLLVDRKSLLDTSVNPSNITNSTPTSSSTEPSSSSSKTDTVDDGSAWGEASSLTAKFDLQGQPMEQLIAKEKRIDEQVRNLHRTGEFKRICTLMAEKIAIVEAGHGLKHIKLIEPLQVLANCLHRLREYTKSNVILDRATDICRSVNPIRNHNLATCLRLRANNLIKINSLEDAVSSCEMAIRYIKAAGNERHASVEKAQVLDTMSMAMMEQGNCKEALKVVEQGLALKMNLFGPNDTKVGASCNAKALILKKLGHYKEAYLAMDKSMDLYIETYSENHPEVMTLLSNQSKLLWDMKMYDDAVNRLNRLLRVQKLNYDSNDKRIIRTIKFLNVARRKAQEANQKENKADHSSINLETDIPVLSSMPTAAELRNLNNALSTKYRINENSKFAIIDLNDMDFLEPRFEFGLFEGKTTVTDDVLSPPRKKEPEEDDHTNFDVSTHEADEKIIKPSDNSVVENQKICDGVFKVARPENDPLPSVSTESQKMDKENIEMGNDNMENDLIAPVVDVELESNNEGTKASQLDESSQVKNSHIQTATSDSENSEINTALSTDGVEDEDKVDDDLFFEDNHEDLLGDNSDLLVKSIQSVVILDKSEAKASSGKQTQLILHPKYEVNVNHYDNEDFGFGYL